MTDDTIQSTFLALLPYYWWPAADLPAKVKPVNVSVRRELAKRLVHTSLRRPDITAYDMRILRCEK